MYVVLVGIKICFWLTLIMSVFSVESMIVQLETALLLSFTFKIFHSISIFYNLQESSSTIPSQGQW